VNARQQYEIIDKMYKKMEKLYNEISEYFVFDKTKYTLDEFFTDINSFREDFKVISPQYDFFPCIFFPSSIHF
jgi:hypothetical protein